MSDSTSRPLAGRVAMVTGGSGGIGAALVDALVLAMLRNGYLTGQIVLLDGGLRPGR